MSDQPLHPLAPQRIAICSWSLRPRSVAELIQGVATFGVPRVQLALDPIREDRSGWGEILTINALKSARIELVSGMMATAGEDYSTPESIARTGGIRPDATWGQNLRAAQLNARLARRLGINLVTLHAGFIPHDHGEERSRMIRRLRQIADCFDECGVRVALETGQETAETLLSALDELDRAHVAVNFDPANMILYGMGDPVAALAQLAPRVVQLHIKDALPAETPGSWGREMPAGTGAVDWTRLFDIVKCHDISGALVVERESGGGRLADAIRARDLVAGHLSRLNGGADA